MRAVRSRGADRYRRCAHGGRTGARGVGHAVAGERPEPETMAVEPSFEMWATLVLTVVAIVAYASERISVELASIGILVALLLLFHFTPLLTGGEALLGPDEVLGGFSSPALIERASGRAR